MLNALHHVRLKAEGIRPWRRRSSSVLVFLACVLVAEVGLLAYSGLRHSPTFNEQAHLPAGLGKKRGQVQNGTVGVYPARSFPWTPG
jgi:hypothetical protein